VLHEYMGALFVFSFFTIITCHGMESGSPRSEEILSRICTLQSIVFRLRGELLGTSLSIKTPQEQQPDEISDVKISKTTHPTLSELGLLLARIKNELNEAQEIQKYIESKYREFQKTQALTDTDRILQALSKLEQQIIEKQSRSPDALLHC